MLLRRLVQNYYDVHGSFIDIQLSFFGEELMSLASESNISLEDLCYTYLGFEGSSTIKPSELCALRSKIL